MPGSAWTRHSPGCTRSTRTSWAASCSPPWGSRRTPRRRRRTPCPRPGRCSPWPRRRRSWGYRGPARSAPRATHGCCGPAAELTRLTGPDPAAWTAVVAAFGYETGYETGGETGGDTEDGPGRTGYRQAYGLLRRAEARLASTAATTAAHAEAVAAVTTDLRAALGAAVGLGAGPLEAAVPGHGRAGGRPARRVAAASRGRRPDAPGALGARPGGGRAHQPAGRRGAFISEKTVSVHLSRVMAKLGANSRTEAVDRGLHAGAARPGGPKQPVTRVGTTRRPTRGHR